jgi:hypothetical protein
MSQDTNSFAKLYYSILSRSSNQINWLIFALLAIIGTNISALYSWHFGNLEYAIKREEINLKQVGELKKHIPRDKKEEITSTMKKENKNEDETIRAFVREKKENFQALYEKCQIATIPLTGVKFIITDFIIILCILGTIFLMWLFTIIDYSKNTLKNFLNYPSLKSSTEEWGVNSLFFLLLPGGGNRRFYRYFELLIALYILLLCSILISNYYDVVKKINPYGFKGMRNMPGWDVFETHVWVSNGIVIVCISICILIFWKALGKMKDLRNLLILLRWYRVAFVPTLHKIFQKMNLKLKKGYNSLEYRPLNETKKLKIVVSLHTINQNDEENSIRFSGDVNLAHSLKKFYKQEEFIPDLPMEAEEELGRKPTFDELKMRHFFEKIFSDKEYETQLYEDFKAQNDNICQSSGVNEKIGCKSTR